MFSTGFEHRQQTFVVGGTLAPQLGQKARLKESDCIVAYRRRLNANLLVSFDRKHTARRFRIASTAGSIHPILPRFHVYLGDSGKIQEGLSQRPDALQDAGNDMMMRMESELLEGNLMANASFAPEAFEKRVAELLRDDFNG